MSTPMTREGVNDPSKLSAEGRKEHYQNRMRPRVRQGAQRALYNAKGVRPAHHDGERF